MLMTGKVRPTRRPASLRPGFRPTLDTLETRQLLAVSPVIQGTVFNDSNGNGALDTTEAPLVGATLNLYAANSTTLLATTTSGADGGYAFTNSNVPGGLTAGSTYTVTETLAGYKNTGAQALSQIDPAKVIAPNSVQVTVVDPTKVVASWTSYAGTPFDAIYYSVNGQTGGTVPTQLGFALTGDKNLASSSLTTLCVGLHDTLSFNTPFATVLDPQSALTNGGRIAYLYNHYALGLTPSGTTYPASIQNLSTKNLTAGLQLAIWQLEYGSSLTLTGYDTDYTSAQDYSDLQTAAAAFVNDSVGKSEKMIILDASLTGNLPSATATPGGQSILATMSYNFGDQLIPPGNITGYVYKDANNDGSRTTGEGPVGGITISLINPTTGAVVATTTSSTTDGSYSFTNVAPGTYTLVEGTATGYLPASTNTGSLTGVTVTSGATSANNNFGEIVPGALSGFVYVDNNNSGLKATNDAPIGGVTISLVNAATGAVVATTTTSNADGSYSFNNLYPGTYNVVEGAVNGYLPSSTNTGSLNQIGVSQGMTTPNNNFGEILPASIAGVVFQDKTGDGLSGDDTILSGVVVQLLGANGAVLASQTVGSNGAYLFGNLAPGTYTVREVTPSGFVQTAPAALTYVVPLVAGQNVTNENFDNYQPVNSACPIGNISYTVVGPCGVSTVCSLGGNTSQGEQVTANFTVGGTTPVTVTLVTYTATSNFDLTKQTIFSVDTETLAPGQHSLTVTIPNSYYQIDFVCGGAISQFNPGANVTYHGEGRFIDADHGGCEVTPASFACLSGMVFVDNNYDGNFAGTDTGLGGVVVRLTGKDTNGQNVTLTRLTNKDGSYSFNGLQPGTYSVSEVTPTGYFTTRDSVGKLNGATLGSITGLDTIGGITLTGSNCAVGYNFGEQVIGAALGCNQTASTCFWASCAGQNLIRSLNGNANATNLGNWLATSFPNSLANLAGKTNSQVAAYFQSAYNSCRYSALTEGLATALAIYVTDSSLAGGNYASCYGFRVTTAGAGAATINVGTTLACYGGPQGNVTLLQLLQYADQNAACTDSWFWYRLACIFDKINSAGCC